MNDKIQKALEMIKIDENGNWFVPNRKMLNMSMSEFIQFERAEFLNLMMIKLKTPNINIIIVHLII
ncbi:MAG: hypothetical protein H9897_02250 [Candidatus Ureaplasma intestinipullorum]|uniref:Uncharacterized protein n=1 Tax=Candidatus Ureaplasma intestinipullorum TaxID=2838770 RepID=A0A9E2KXM6_9BACT|nr:hypothetical protein [Candidatus Ureaplasma intestinipullorum]